MFRNYLITAWRNMVRGGFYSVINMLGLAMGLSCFFLIALFIKDELGYDKFHTKHNRIHRVIGILELEGQGEQSSSCPFPVGPTLIHEYPDQIEHAVRFFNFQDPQHTLRVGDKKINESRIFVADSNVFDVFDFPLEKGDAKTALADPDRIVMTRTMAAKYFGNDDPIGKTIRFDGTRDLTVTGILADIPRQSHIHFDALISFSTLRTMMPGLLKNWVWNPNWTYVLLKEGVTPAQLESQFPEFVQKYYPEFLKPQVTHLLQPLDDIHLHSAYSYEIEPNGDMALVGIFFVIGIVILLIACINFMNLATARSAGRAKEVGIRKVSGATRGQLIMQFLSESLAMVGLSVLISFAIVAALIPLFNAVTGKQMGLHDFLQPEILLWVAGSGVITGFLAGIYPAFYLSAFRPVAVLKGRLSSGSRNTLLRRMLVILQFSISVTLIIGTGMVYLQLAYMRKASLGFDKDQLLMIPLRPPMAEMFEPLRNELRSDPGVAGVTRMNDVIGKHHNIHEYNYKGMQPGKWIYFASLLVDEEFIPTMNMQLVAGRNFSKEFPKDDSLAVIVNEAMVKHMQWASNEAALGQQFYTPSGYEKVIGVVKDFHFESLHTPLGPFVLDIPHPKHLVFWTRYFGVRLKSGDIPETIHRIEKIWSEYSTEFPFEYFFLDDDLSKQYKAQESLASLITYFSMLAILIACLGLLGLASYAAEQRTKEIGIRKVMGAEVSSIVMLLSWDFLKPVCIAVLIAWPLSWFVLKRWLEGFAFHTEISWLLFGLSGLAALLIAWVTVAVRAALSAMGDPAKSLRYE